MSIFNDVSLAILAGGQATRLGGINKALLELDGKFLIQHVAERFSPFCQATFLCLHDEDPVMEKLGYPILYDQQSEYHGPLAGVCSALQAITTEWLFVSPCDAPFTHTSVLENLYAVRDQASVLVAHDGNNRQPAFALIQSGMLGNLQAYLKAGKRKVGHWQDLAGAKDIDCSEWSDSFLNINNNADLEAARQQFAPS